MLEELAGRSGAAAWAIGSMLFFLAAFAAVVVWVLRRPREEMAARARLPLEDERPGMGKTAITDRGTEISDQATGNKGPGTLES